MTNYNPSRFFQGYQIILPNGYRLEVAKFLTFQKIVTRNISIELQRAKETLFMKGIRLEAAAEKEFQLPKGYLSGVSEAYPSIILCCGLAKLEQERGIRSDLLPISSSMNHVHVDLLLVASINISKEVDTDIMKVVKKEKRQYCNCLLCLPGRGVNEQTKLTNTECKRMACFMKNENYPFNFYLPFRRRGLRKSTFELIQAN